MLTISRNVKISDSILVEEVHLSQVQPGCWQLVEMYPDRVLFEEEYLSKGVFKVDADNE